MKTAVILLIWALQISWAYHLDGESRKILEDAKYKVKQILEKYKAKDAPPHDFFSNPKNGENINQIVNHHVSDDTHIEEGHLNFLNHMVHGLVDVVEKTNGPLSVNLYRFNYSGIAAKKYREDWDKNTTFVGNCSTFIHTSLQYQPRAHNITHIKDCIEQGVLRILKEPNSYLLQLFDALERAGMCGKNLKKPVCAVSNNYNSNADICDYSAQFTTPVPPKLVPLKELTAEKHMAIECVDKKFRAIRIEYTTIVSCAAMKMPELNPMD